MVYSPRLDAGDAARIRLVCEKIRVQARETGSFILCMLRLNSADPEFNIVSGLALVGSSVWLLHMTKFLRLCLQQMSTEGLTPSLGPVLQAVLFLTNADVWPAMPGVPSAVVCKCVQPVHIYPHTTDNFILFKVACCHPIRAPAVRRRPDDDRASFAAAGASCRRRRSHR